MVTGFEDRVKVVTGAGRGIGKAPARAFAQRGTYVAIADVDHRAVDTLAQDLRRGSFLWRRLAW